MIKNTDKFYILLVFQYLDLNFLSDIKIKIHMSFFFGSARISTNKEDEYKNEKSGDVFINCTETLKLS